MRSMSAVVSVMLAPPSEARVCWKLSESDVIRYVTLMALPETPADVAPPLLPENAMHGGEYGSPGTCSVCPGHPPDLPERLRRRGTGGLGAGRRRAAPPPPRRLRRQHPQPRPPTCGASCAAGCRPRRTPRPRPATRSPRPVAAPWSAPAWPSSKKAARSAANGPYPFSSRRWPSPSGAAWPRCLRRSHTFLHSSDRSHAAGAPPPLRTATAPPPGPRPGAMRPAQAAGGGAAAARPT